MQLIGAGTFIGNTIRRPIWTMVTPVRGHNREVADFPGKIQEARHILMSFDGARRGLGALDAGQERPL